MLDIIDETDDTKVGATTAAMIMKSELEYRQSRDMAEIDRLYRRHLLSELEEADRANTVAPATVNRKYSDDDRADNRGSANYGNQGRQLQFQATLAPFANYNMSAGTLRFQFNHPVPNNFYVPPSPFSEQQVQMRPYQQQILLQQTLGQRRQNQVPAFPLASLSSSSALSPYISAMIANGNFPPHHQTQYHQMLGHGCAASTSMPKPPSDNYSPSLPTLQNPSPTFNKVISMPDVHCAAATRGPVIHFESAEPHDLPVDVPNESDIDQIDPIQN